MKTHSKHICTSTCNKTCIFIVETAVDCSVASSCDSSPSFIEIHSKKRKMNSNSNYDGRRNERSNKGKGKLYDDGQIGHNQVWHNANVIYFIDEMHKLWEQGMLLGGTLGSQQAQSLAITMQIGVPIPSHIPWTPKQLQTKARNLRVDWRMYHDLLTKQTGWGIDPDTGFIEAPEGAWEAFCEAHPTFDKELIRKPFQRYQLCTDMWVATTATGRYARATNIDTPIELDDDVPPRQHSRGTNEGGSGKRSSRDWRDDDPKGAVRMKTSIGESVKQSLDAWSQLNDARKKTLTDDNEKVDVAALNAAVLTFQDEVGIEACVRAIDILLARREIAFSWMMWPRDGQLYWIRSNAL